MWNVWKMCFLHTKHVHIWTSKCKNCIKNRNMLNGVTTDFRSIHFLGMWRIGIHNVCVFWVTRSFKGVFRGQIDICHGISILTISIQFFHVYRVVTVQNGSTVYLLFVKLFYKIVQIYTYFIQLYTLKSNDEYLPTLTNKIGTTHP